MSRFFPDAKYKTSFCVDTSSIDHPYLVTSRATELYSRASDLYPENIELGWELGEVVDDFHTSEFVHDRWPRCFVKMSGGMTSTTQFVSSGHTIFQVSEFDFRASIFNGSFPKIKVNTNLLIRELDFFTPPDTPNGGNGETAEAPYKTLISDRGDFIMRSRLIDQHNETVVALFISVLSRSKYFSFEETDGEVLIIPNDELLTLFKTGGKFTIVTAFTLALQPSQNLPSTAPVSFQDFESAMECLKPDQYEEQTFTTDQRLNFCLQRNLEHILSVCSIPVTPPDQYGGQIIALTCGDLDGHRVATSASL